jgi:NADPH-dependent curcumin reductase CurA
MPESESVNRAVVLKARPPARSFAAADPANFELVEQALPALAEGEVRLRNIYLSLDPYMASYMLGQHPIGVPVEARVVSQVAASRNPALAAGDLVWGFFGWEQFTTLPASLADRKGYPVIGNRIDPATWPKGAPISHAISVLGMPGLTAYAGLVEIGRPQPGETVYVSSAAGAVGQVAGQLAKIKGARVVGSAGGDDKVDYCLSLGFDAAFNYKTAPGGIEAALRRLCPDGIDIYFDNVGGTTLEAALNLMNVHGRVPICGMISTYGTDDGVGVRNLFRAVRQRLTLTGFTIYDHFPQKMPAFLAEMGAWFSEGRVRYAESIVDGLDNLPQAFADMLSGRQGVGKCLVRVSEDPLPAD